MEDLDLGASKPIVVEKPEPSRTLVLPEVIACGHSIDLRHPPTQANCEECWRAFFAAANLPMLHKFLTDHGRANMEKLLGKKFIKRFGKFLQQQLLVKEEPKVEPSIEGSILDVSAEREATLGGI